MRNYDYYRNEKGEIGVMVSHGYGAGWSTWAGNIDIALDSRIIEKYLELKKDEQKCHEINHAVNDNSSTLEFKEFLKELGYGDVYLGGLIDCTIEFVPENSLIRIDEYDGAETLVVGTTDMHLLN